MGEHHETWDNFTRIPMRISHRHTLKLKIKWHFRIDTIKMYTPPVMSYKRLAPEHLSSLFSIVPCVACVRPGRVSKWTPGESLRRCFCSERLWFSPEQTFLYIAAIYKGILQTPLRVINPGHLLNVHHSLGSKLPCSPMEITSVRYTCSSMGHKTLHTQCPPTRPALPHSQEARGLYNLSLTAHCHCVNALPLAAPWETSTIILLFQPPCILQSLA